MNPEHQQLLQRIEAFSLDEPGAISTFTERLAKENHWDAAYARRVVVEYKRFAFLAVAAGHRVSPSDQVDQAWHLHLVFTDSYWNRFCAEVLRRPFHHQPSQGGAGERAKFGQWYEQTLASYRRLFGAEPPADIWPPAPIRASEDPHYTRVNTRRHWVVPKPSRRLVRFSSLTVLLCLTAGAGLVADGSPKIETEWTWVMNTVLYVVALVVGCLVGSKVADRWVLGPDLPADYQAPADPYALAYLVRAEAHAVNTAVVSMVQRGIIQVAGEKAIVSRVMKQVQLSHPLERAIWANVKPETGIKLSRLRGKVSAEVRAIVRRLRAESLLLTPLEWCGAVFGPGAVTLVITVGAVLALYGWQWDSNLGGVLLPCGILSLAVANTNCYRRKPAHIQLVSQLQDKHRGLSALADQWDAVTPGRLALVIALFDLAPLADTPLAELQTLLLPARGASSGCGGGGCGGGGCGGGCGGGDSG